MDYTKMFTKFFNDFIPGDTVLGPYCGGAMELGPYTGGARVLDPYTGATLGPWR